MLKTGLTLLTIALATSANAAAETQPVAAQAGQDVKAEVVEASKVEITKFEVELSQNGNVINSYTTYAPVGATSRYQNTVKTSYIESGIKRDGVVKYNTGAVVSGFEMTLTPTVSLASGKMLISFDASYRKLNAIKKIKQDDMEVESPETSEFTMKQLVAVKKGESIQVSSIQQLEKPESYTITIRAK
jgi:hypothetical protein